MAVRVQPMSFEGIVAHVVGVVTTAGCDSAGPDSAVRLVVDGHPSTHPEHLADALVDPLRAAGRPVARVRTRDFLRPASLRLERGRRDPDSLLDGWIDVEALNREVLSAVGPGGTGRYLPTLRDPETSRATRAPYVEAPPGIVVVLDGSLTLGRWLDLDLAVHLALRPATEARRTAPDDAWTLAAYERYREEVAPEESADVVVRVDDAEHPALVVRA